MTICSARKASPLYGKEPVFDDKNERGLALTQMLALISTGRRGGIRTRDPLHPMQVRYQAALHAEDVHYNALSFKFLTHRLWFTE